MKGYWFFRRCLILKHNLLSASAINWQIIFAHPPLLCGGDPGYPLWACFVWLREWCEWGQVKGLPRVMSWGLLLTPTPALVPAATSTRYCTPVCSPPTTTERMVASTDLLTWKRVSLARHQIWQRQTRQTGFIQQWHATLSKQIAFAALSVFDPTLYSWMMPFCWSEGGGSHDTLMEVLLWLPVVNTVTCCGGAPGAGWGRGENT